MGDCQLRPPKQKSNGSFETFCELVYDGLEDLPAKSELFWSYGNDYWQIKKHWEQLFKDHQYYLVNNCGLLGKNIK